MEEPESEEEEFLSEQIQRQLRLKFYREDSLVYEEREQFDIAQDISMEIKSANSSLPSFDLQDTPDYSGCASMEGGPVT